MEYERIATGLVDTTLLTNFEKKKQIDEKDSEKENMKKKNQMWAII